MVLEGGSIDVNGAGAAADHRGVPAQPGAGAQSGAEPRARSKRRCGDYLGVDRVIWLRNGIAGDDTHGHVDDLARFVCRYRGGRRRNRPLRPQLRAAARKSGVAAPVAIARGEAAHAAPLIFSGQRLPASYANFYIANKLVLVPTFNDPHDRVALNTLARVFPDREVAGIHAVELVWGLGTLHCMTQQQPQARGETAP